MTDQEKLNNLFKLCARQIEALKAGGFSAGDTYENGDIPKYYMHDDAPMLFMNSLDYDAYKYLKDRGLVDTGICPMCGFAPTTNDYKFIDHFDHRLQFSICYQCHSDKQINVKNLAKVSKCYIATICYESDVAEEVLVFRKYRDLVLSKSLIGRMFISSYYFIAPTISDFLYNKKFINRTIIKFVLNPIYKLLK